MWAPSEVTREYRNRANAIWVCLVIVWIGYGVWIIVDAVEKQQNPATSTSMTIEAFTFPDIGICFFSGMGCESTNTSACASSVRLVDISVSGTFDHGADFELPVFTPLGEEEFPSVCRSIELSSLTPSTMNLDSENTSKSLEVSLQVYWALNGHTGDVLDYENAVNVYMTDLSQDPELLRAKPSIGALPYTRLEANTFINTFRFNQVDLAMIEYRPLQGKPSRVYSAGSIITSEYHSSQGFSSGNETLGFLQVGFRENKLYYVTTEEVNALSMASTIGSLGGFWQYILIAWGFFFISKEPENKIKIARRLGKLEEHLGWLKEEKGQGEVTIASEGARSSSQNTPRNKKELEDHTVLQQGEVPLSSHDVHPSNMAEV